MTTIVRVGTQNGVVVSPAPTAAPPAVTTTPEQEVVVTPIKPGQGPPGPQGPPGDPYPIVVSTTMPGPDDYGEDVIPLYAIWVKAPS